MCIVKQLTQAEFDALPNDRPIDARVDGLPPEYLSVLFWDGEDWTECAMCTGYKGSESLRWNDDSGRANDINHFPIYHKLPDDYVEDEL